jgi:ASC-1-like (ASCH) protein
MVTFEQILDGTRTFVAQLFEESWQDIRMGDTVIFRMMEGTLAFHGAPEYSVRVKSIAWYPSFYDGIADVGLRRVHPGENCIECVIENVYYKCYSEAAEKDRGVVVFGF